MLRPENWVQMLFKSISIALLRNGDVAWHRPQGTTSSNNKGDARNSLPQKGCHRKPSAYGQATHCEGPYGEKSRKAWERATAYGTVSPQEAPP